MRFMVPLNWQPKADRFDVACGFRNMHDRRRCLLYPSKADIGRNLATVLRGGRDRRDISQPQFAMRLADPHW
jgi:hypothetical protein